MPPAALVNWGEFAATLAGVLAPVAAGAWWIVKSVRTWSKGLGRRLDAQDRMAANITHRLDLQDAAFGRRLDAQDAQLETIHHEVTPNSGGSIKDAVRRIEADISRHDRERAHADEALDLKIDRLASRFDAHVDLIKRDA